VHGNTVYCKFGFGSGCGRMFYSIPLGDVRRSLTVTEIVAGKNLFLHSSYIANNSF